ncbi:MAG: hypothetical protein IJQ90_02960 [Alphaproteobacteria bacterium]|nr:hypothetical protein [Alphaproteobacteria bacterium]
MRFLILSLLLTACAGSWTPPDDFVRRDIPAAEYEIATYGKITNENAPVHIYIEGDGHAFTAYGEPTTDPTPRGTLVRNLAARDMAPNVAYIARPCQFIMSPACSESDWTDGRFSPAVVDATANAIKEIAGRRPVVLVGYSGGGLLAGLIINRHPEIKVQKWITIAGVPNHTAWTRYFGDDPLTKSLDLEKLPNVPAIHYVGARDRVVPPELSRKFWPTDQIVEIPGAGHTDFENLDIEFN